MNKALCLVTGAALLSLAACHTAPRQMADNNMPLLFQDGEKQLLLQYGDFWSGIKMFTADAGFAYSKITLLDNGHFRIESESVVRLRMLQQSKELTYHSSEVVSPDLLLQSFRHHQISDGYMQNTTGYVEGKQLHLTVQNASGEHRQSHTLTAPLFAYSASLLYPALHGLQEGAQYSYMVYDNEAREPKLLQQSVYGPEPSPTDGNPAWRIESLFRGLDTISWLDQQIRPIMEEALDGNIVVTSMSEEQAIKILARASINKSENLLDFSIVRTTEIPQPRNLNQLELSISGLPDSFILPEQDGRQACQSESAGEMRCTIEAKETHQGQMPTASDVAATTIINTDHPRIRSLAQDITSEKHPAAQIDAILYWIGNNIRSEVVDVFTALDVLDSGRGECQGQTFLYTSLARTLDIPTKVVNGLIYSEEHQGFLYHTWAESWDGTGWRSVDPAFRQHVADASHIRLVTGDQSDDIAPLAHIIGRISANIANYN